MGPGGDLLLAANGMLLASLDNASQDMQLLVQLPATHIVAAAFDPGQGLIALADDTSLEFFDSHSYALIGQGNLTSAPSMLAIRGEDAIATSGSQVFAVRLPRLHRYGVSPTYTFADAGTYAVALTVWDAAGNSATDNVTITVRDTTPPVARAGPDATLVHGTSVDLDGSASSDNVGTVNYTWRFYDGSWHALYGERVSYVFDAIGTYDVSLDVADAAGNRDSDVVTITVVRDPVRPIANAGPDQTVYAGMRVTFNGSASWDNVRVANYTWILTDYGQVILYGVRPSYVFERPGTYAVALTVADDDSNVGSAAMTVVVVGVSMVQVAPYRSGFRIGVVDTWVTRVGVDVPNAGTADVLAEGSSLGAGPASLLVKSRQGSFTEQDISLLSAASESISQIRGQDPTATLLQEPRIVPTANSRAAMFEVSLQSGTLFQLWAIVVSEAHARMWIVIGTSFAHDANTYRVVFLAAIRSFLVEPMSWPQRFPILLGASVVGSGTALGALAFLTLERTRRGRSRTRFLRK